MKKPSNKLSVWTFPYRRSYYLLRPWKWVHDAYWNIRNFMYRGRYGYGYIDAWNWFEWWCYVGAAALRYMAEKGSGYPGVSPWETPEKWNVHLHKLADELEWCSDTEDICYTDKYNEYVDEMRDVLKQVRSYTDENGDLHEQLDLTPEQKELRDNYFAREKEIMAETAEKRAEIFAGIGRNLGKYWD